VSDEGSGIKEVRGGEELRKPPDEELQKPTAYLLSTGGIANQGHIIKGRSI